MDEEFVYVLEKKPNHGLNHYSNIIVKSLKGYVLQMILLPSGSFITLKTDDIWFRENAIVQI